MAEEGGREMVALRKEESLGWGCILIVGADEEKWRFLLHLAVGVQGSESNGFESN